MKIGALKRLTSNLDFLHAHGALFLLKNCLLLSPNSYMCYIAPQHGRPMTRSCDGHWNPYATSRWMELSGVRPLNQPPKVVLASDGPKILHYLPSCPPPMLLLILSAPCCLPMRLTALVISQKAWIYGGRRVANLYHLRNSVFFSVYGMKRS